MLIIAVLKKGLLHDNSAGCLFEFLWLLYMLWLSMPCRVFSLLSF